MNLLHTRNSWIFSRDFSKEIDFCVWVLEVDGLHVPPFDQHPDGDGSLRAAGLAAENWQSWLVRIVDLQYRQNQALKQPSPKGSLPPSDWRPIFIPEALEPAL